MAKKKKRLESFSKTATLQDQDITLPNNASCLTPPIPAASSFRIQIQKNLPIFDKLNDME